MPQSTRDKVRESLAKPSSLSKAFLRILDPEILTFYGLCKLGIFQFDIDVHHTLDNMYPAQSRQFLNLKKSIVRHMCESQTHINLKEKYEKESIAKRPKVQETMILA